ncbi:YoaK family protein [Weissella bombi]|uniref:Uncharacterized membrane protein YoaK, UPF0700 family n=1 Tax=Weissella bombi TaxID=1505725 RepID=A0A1C4AB21_9LACO|nr:YoaK family protein [Weissella bombi]SCB91743.1 Uncharacterized membrane protein YoaK, UPF0700 family [Weissella bombi]
MIHNYPIKESMRTGMLLAATAGFIDAYTFTIHDMRFASFQSGNLLQIGLNVAGGKWLHALLYFWPVFAFLIGTSFNQLLKHFAKNRHQSHTMIALLVELIGLIVVALLEYNNISADIILPLLAFFMAIQADTFNLIHGMPYMTILSTGNLRTLSSGLTNGLLWHDKESLHRAGRVAPVILAFFISAILAFFAIQLFHQGALFIAPILILGLLILVNREEKQE